MTWLNFGGLGKAVVETLVRDLQAEFPGRNGFSARNLWNMRDFFREYSDQPKLQPLVAEISWAKNLVILGRCKDPLQREFYLRATARFGWTKAVLQHQVDNQSYEKYLLNQTNFDQTLPEAIKAQAALAVKDHYSFDFLELAEEHSERQLEQALVANLRQFLAELGGAFAFIGNQHRLEVDDPPIGIIICRGKNKTVVEYALRNAARPLGIATYSVVPSLPASYLAELPSAQAIADRLQRWDEQRIKTEEQ